MVDEISFALWVGIYLWGNQNTNAMQNKWVKVPCEIALVKIRLRSFSSLWVKVGDKNLYDVGTHGYDSRTNTQFLFEAITKPHTGKKFTIEGELVYCGPGIAVVRIKDREGRIAEIDVNPNSLIYT